MTAPASSGPAAMLSQWRSLWRWLSRGCSAASEPGAVSQGSDLPGRPRRHGQALNNAYVEMCRLALHGNR